MTDSAPAEGRKDKRCDICSRRFARSEHLTRHRLTHTKERPYFCNLCNRSFQRADVKALHLKKCQGVSADPSNNDNGFSGSPRKRVRLACNRCRQKKIACNGQEPCSHCRNAPFDCEYAGSKDVADGGSDGMRLNAEEASFADDQDPEPSSIAPLSTAPSVEEGDLLSASSFALGQDTHQASFLPTAQKDASLVIPNAVLHVDLDLSLPTGDLLDPVTMNDIWQMPPFDSQFWLDGSDLAWSEAPFDATFLMPEYSAPSASQQRVTGIMQEYFDRKSRKSSPSAPDKASFMWYSAPPNLDDHDLDVVNIFVNLFHKHVSDTFTLFKEIHTPKKAHPEFTLAMAATGGLFCSVAGSAEVAKSMYNDSRRILLASHHKKKDIAADGSNRKGKLLDVCTFILLQLYGLCSGDKRSYEFVEAFYGHLIHAVKDYGQSRLLSSDEEKEKENEDVLLLESLYVLDCYRVIILYRPPCFPWRHANSFAQSDSASGRMDELLRYPAILTEPHYRTTKSVVYKDPLVTLASLSTYLWPAASLSESAGHSDMLDREPSQASCLWKSDFVGMACDTWLRSQQELPLPTLVIYHHINTMLHSNLVLVQRFAHSPPTSTARDPQKSAIAKAIQSWLRGRDCTIARWHAEQLISTVESAMTASKSSAGYSDSHLTTASSSQGKPTTRTFEAPHTPYAVYYATLILWCSDLKADFTSTSVASSKALLARGEMILSAHKARIAQLLARVLADVK